MDLTGWIDRIDWKVATPMTISFLALATSTINLYLTQIRRAELSFLAGEHINVYHFKEGNCGITLPISITNTGAKSATVNRLSLLVCRPGVAGGYLLEPLFFEKVDENRDFKAESQPVPIVILGKSSVTKQVLFRSALVVPPDFQLTAPGTYEMTVIGWTMDKAAATLRYSFAVTVTAEDASTLVSELEARSAATVRLRQIVWGKWAARGLRADEIEKLWEPLG